MIVRTVWYELLYGEWPFKGQPPETIVWQVSHGIKPSLSNLQASKDVKVCIHETLFRHSFVLFSSLITRFSCLTRILLVACRSF